MRWGENFSLRIAQKTADIALLCVLEFLERMLCFLEFLERMWHLFRFKPPPFRAFINLRVWFYFPISDTSESDSIFGSSHILFTRSCILIQCFWPPILGIYGRFPAWNWEHFYLFHAEKLTKLRAWRLLSKEV